MRLVKSEGGTGPVLWKAGRACLLCTNADNYPHRLNDGVESIPRWQCPHRSGILTWLFGLTVPSAIFFSLVAPFLVGEAPVAVLVTAVLSYLACTLLMGLTSFSDPGTVPPATSATRRQPMGHSEVVINGVSVTLKYCVACGIQRPPRASHCRETNRCVEKWDHYCPWVGNSIGRRNYHWFLAFVYCTLLHGLYLGSLSTYALTRLVHAELEANTAASLGDGLTAAFARMPFGCALIVYCGLVTLLLCMLGGYHAYLVTLNQTTNENVRGVWEDTRNPYDNGARRNWAEVCLGCGRPPTDQRLRAGTDEEAMLPAQPAMLPGVSASALELGKAGGGGGDGDGDGGGDGGGRVAARQTGQEMLPVSSAMPMPTADEGADANSRVSLAGDEVEAEGSEEPLAMGERSPSLEQLAVAAAARRGQGDL